MSTHQLPPAAPPPMSALRPSGALGVITNIIWLVLGGLWLACGYLVAGIIACVFVVTIPFGIAAFRLARYTLWPFGSHLLRRPDAGIASSVGNIVWILFFGWWLALGHVLAGVALCLTVIGIPLGIACFRLVPVSLTPLGRYIVSA